MPQTSLPNILYIIKESKRLILKLKYQSEAQIKQAY